jgi:enoyl-CoA hydratase/carnithine racemase
MTEVGVRLEIVERDEGCTATVTVCNERRLNILDETVLECFEARLAELHELDDLRVAVVTGAGERAFVGGADIRLLAELDPASARAFISAVHRICASIRALPVPSIARISGYCLGAGLEIAASCDLRVATEQSQFGMPEVQVGVPSVVEAALLPQLIGWGRTRELVFAGRSFMARQVEGWGLVERVVAQSELDTAVGEWVESIVRAGPRAIRLQKILLRQWERLPLEEAIEAGIEIFAEAYDSDEPRERAQLFLDRRRS